MNKNLFVMEMRRNASTLLLWMLVIVGLITATMLMYQTFYENQSKMMGMMSLVPKGALQFKGISNVNDLLSALGFYTANNVIYLMLLGSVFSIVLAGNILLKEEYHKTAEYLLTRPLNRSDIFFSKLSVVFLNIFLLNLVSSSVGYILIELVKEGPFRTEAFWILTLYTLLLNCMFAGLGLFISTLVKRAKPITTLLIGLVLILYFVHTLSKITQSAASIGYLSPFKYVDMNVLSAKYQLDYRNLLFFVGFTLLFLVLSHRLYTRKDIYL
jgi:ABC-2 type transport system permease protein